MSSGDLKTKSNPVASRPNTGAAAVWRVLEKEMRCEYRSKYALNAMLLFCVTCAAVVSFSLGGRVGDSRVQSALLWVVVFFSAMSGLSRGFVKEEESGTIRLLRVTCEPGPVFFGKAVFNLALLLGAVALLSVLFLVLLNVDFKNAALYCLGAALASAAVSVLCTLISAIVAGARVRGTLFPILSFPILLPVFAAAVQVTRMALDGATLAQGAHLLWFLAAYTGASVIVSAFLFEFLFYD